MTLSRPAFPSSGFFFCLLWLLAGVASPAAARHHRYINKHTVSTTSVVAAGVTVFRGRASWYGIQFQGHRTSSGERFNRFTYTCAHRTLPFGTRLRVTNVKTHRSVVVRVADRGPFRHQRILDLAELAARPLGIVEQGAATVIAEVVAATTPLGVTDAPANLLALVAADPDPSAAHATYPAPLAADTAVLAQVEAPATAPAADSLVPARLATAAPAGPAAKPRFVLQAGTFADLQNARAMQANLLLLDHQLTVELATEVLAGREMNRVVVSQLDSWLAAETVRRRLQLWGIASLVRQLPAEQAAASTTLAAVAPAPVVATPSE